MHFQPYISCIFLASIFPNMLGTTYKILTHLTDFMKLHACIKGESLDAAIILVYICNLYCSYIS